MTQSIATTFEDVISTWSEHIPCSWGTRSGRPCRLPAKWDVDIHGCGGGTICTRHFNQWLKMCEPHAESKICEACKGTFPVWTEAYRAVSL